MGRCSRELVKITRGLLSFGIERKHNCERRQPKTISSDASLYTLLPPEGPSTVNRDLNSASRSFARSDRRGTQCIKGNFDLHSLDKYP